MATSSSTPLSLLIPLSFSLLSLTSASTLTKAVTILADSGYNTVSVALDRAANSVSSPPPSLTVFAPTDAAFSASGAGEPSLDVILFHLSPVAFPPGALKSLPLGARIKTLRSGHSVAVTYVSADGLVSLSNVPVKATPLFNDGSLIVYGIDSLFQTASYCWFTEAIEVLRSHGCSVTASFLEMESIRCGTSLTVFAPVDQVLVNRFGDLSLFRRHVAHGYLSWSDLVSLEEGTVLMTKLQGFTIKVSRYDGVLVLNRASVIMPEIFRSDWLVVHAIGDILDLRASAAQCPISPNQSAMDSGFSNVSSEGAFSRSDEIEKVRETGLVVFIFMFGFVLLWMVSHIFFVLNIIGGLLRVYVVSPLVNLLPEAAQEVIRAHPIPEGLHLPTNVAEKLIRVIAKLVKPSPNPNRIEAQVSFRVKYCIVLLI